MAPAVGFEPTTNRLTADRSTTELRWIAFGECGAYSCVAIRAGQALLWGQRKLLAQHLSEKVGCGGWI